MSQTWESEVTDVRKVGRADRYKIMGHFGKTNKVILISLSVTFRSSHLEMFYKKILKTLGKLTGKNWNGDLSLQKINCSYFLVNFSKLFRTIIQW